MTIRLAVLIAPMLLAMVLTAWRAWRGDTVSLVVVACLVAVWSRIDAEFEGPKILRMVDGHSLVLADLVGIVTALAAVVGWLRARSITPDDQGPVGAADDGHDRSMTG